MSGKRGTSAEILRRQQRIEELLAEGIESSVKIAELLTAEGFVVSDRHVRRHVEQVAAEWRERIVSTHGIRQLQQVADTKRRSKELKTQNGGPKS